jgi:hypothetical protein
MSLLDLVMMLEGPYWFVKCYHGHLYMFDNSMHYSCASQMKVLHRQGKRLEYAFKMRNFKGHAMMRGLANGTSFLSSKTISIGIITCLIIWITLQKSNTWRV